MGVNITGIAVTAILACLTCGALALGEPKLGWILAIMTVGLGGAIALEGEDV